MIGHPIEKRERRAGTSFLLGFFSALLLSLGLLFSAVAMSASLLSSR
jgi:hypothetical protein